MPAPRSPSYPNISLTEAINKARQIYQKENMSNMTPEVAAEGMGYTGINGASLKTIAALKKWGLLEGRADDLRLTPDAQSLSIDDPDSPDYRAALARCAAAPEVFGEINKQFPSGASERNIAVFLQKNGFQPDAASTVAKHFKETLALVSGGGAPYSGGEDQPDPPMRTAEESVQARHQHQRQHHPAYRGGETAPPLGLVAAEATRQVGDADAPFRITMDGKKLHIVADVDLAELQVLKQMLDGYENMLKLLKRPAGQAVKPEWADATFSPGDTVPADGWYDAFHNGHTGSGPQNYSKGARFAACNECQNDGIRYKAR